MAAFKLYDKAPKPYDVEVIAVLLRSIKYQKVSISNGLNGTKKIPRAYATSAAVFSDKALWYQIRC